MTDRTLRVKFIKLAGFFNFAGIMDERKFLIVVGGPTASGKTDFAVRLAKHFQTEIISCDSRQFYAQMLIGTAWPDKDQLEGVPHHFIGHLPIEADYSVGQFERDALVLLEKLFQKYEIVVVVGGSGMYIKALCEGLDSFPEVPINIKTQVEKLYAEEGLTALQNKLQELDPEYFQIVDLQNPQRLTRALSVSLATGRPYSSFRQNAKAKRSFTPIYLQITDSRDKIYTRINQRVLEMMEQGLLEEARRLYPLRHYNALQTVGYQELFQHFEGQLDIETAIALIQQNTRHYAKRQLTWLRRDGFWKQARPDELEVAMDYISMVTDAEGGILKTDHTADNIENTIPYPLPAAYWISWQKAGITIAQIPAWIHRRELLLGFSTAPNLQEIDKMLYHEACRSAEGNQIWAVCHQAQLDLLKNLGFVETNDNSWPARWQWEVLEQPDSIKLVYQKT